MKKCLFVVLSVFLLASCSTSKYKIINKQTGEIALPEPAGPKVVQSPHVVTLAAQMHAAFETMPEVLIVTLPNQLKVMIPSDEMFKKGSAKFASEEHPRLDAFYDVMKAYPHANIRVEGLTDSSGYDELNLHLSEDRAQHTADYLVSLGMNPDEFVIKGYGSAFPLDSNDTPEGRANNRRIVLTVLG